VTTKTEGAHDIRTVLQSVKDHWAQVRRPKLSEADTRAHFIDPLLRALGYRLIGDVQHEVYVDTAKQYLDYQLLVDALPRVAVEAKAIDVGLNDSHGAQVVQYCSVLGIEWAVVTNGREWRLYHGFANGPLAEKLLSAVDLVAWESDAQFNAVFEQLWLVSKGAFQSSGGPAAWLVAKQLDGALRKTLADATSPEIKYIRKRLADQGVTSTTEELAAWFNMHLEGAGSSGQSQAPSAGSAGGPVPIQTSTELPVPPPAVNKQPPSVGETRYYRLMLGSGSVHAAESLAGGFVGTDFGIAQDLSNDLPEDWRVFNRKFIPVYLASHPSKKPVAAGLACGAIWTVSKGLRVGDVVLCPNGKGQYLVGRIAGGYSYAAGGVLPHRRPVTWLGASIDRSAMSKALRNSTGSIGTVSNVSGYRDEIEQLLAGKDRPQASG
jgi:type I restriction and modification enzyme subunit R-like protein